MNSLDKYIVYHTTEQDELLAELERETFMRAIHPHMISGHIQGKLLEMLTRMLKPRNVLEIGTFTGYSTLSIAAGLDDAAVIHTIEANDELQEISADFFSRSPHGSKIRAYTGSALDVAPELDISFDMVFIDGGKKEYPGYYTMLMGDGKHAGHGALVHSGSYIIADNILWYGKVADATTIKDADTKAIDEFNRTVFQDTRVENVILPLRDGLNVIRVL